MKFAEVRLAAMNDRLHYGNNLHFDSHHPIEHKLSVVRTLFDRSQSLISDSIRIDT